MTSCASSLAGDDLCPGVNARFRGGPWVFHVIVPNRGYTLNILCARATVPKERTNDL